MRLKPDVDALLSQILTWLLLVSYMAVAYVVVVAIATLSLGDVRILSSPPWWLDLSAVVLIALTFMPVHRWVRAGVHGLIYSQHEHPYPALAQLDRRFDSTFSLQAILPTIAETIAHTLKLPYTAIEAQLGEPNMADGPLVAAYGKPPAGAAIERVPLSYRSKVVGELSVAARRSDEPLSQSDLAVLRDLAHHVGISLYAAQLTADLQHARERLVIAREEERRRMRNDLHDGLAPTLSSFQLQLGAVRNLMRQNPDQAETIINDLREDLREATATIRQLVYDLRPPMLDELGLVGAIKSLNLSGSEFCLEVHSPEPLPALPAAIEVAVYRIATEAIHNVSKHAQATECVVCIDVAGGLLTLRVTDNGKGMPDSFKAGVGTHSMQERAAELGATLSVQSDENGGACVIGRFPLAG